MAIIYCHRLYPNSGQRHKKLSKLWESMSLPSEFDPLPMPLAAKIEKAILETKMDSEKMEAKTLLPSQLHYATSGANKLYLYF